ncbi:hypothetical protein FA13DRAFT_1709075 [Coprinellus micaceus]|uniref:F-box domain-containing protein n=1 Tax=Coprinellus micaceus TaxID=71717 RepID=A0A4Y7TF14_COPMI|nr:hypothetical protein FA13DRAFT_1709075 [Coprinellus micaceus]
MAASEAAAQSAAACRADLTSFSALRSLTIRSWTFFYAGSVLEFLPPRCKLEHLEVTCPRDIHPDECQTVIDAIQHYCNPQSLRSIEFYDCTDPDVRLNPEPLDVDPGNDEDDEDSGDDVDIWKLSQFTKLATLIIRWGGEMRLRREDIPKLVETWPYLEHLDLCSIQYSDGRIPAFDHNDVLKIVQRLPSLHFLGLRFDATQLPREQTTASSTSPPRLLTLRVGESPISSPSRVVKFLNDNFPRLKGLDTQYISPPSRQVPTMLDKRWAQVTKSLFQV